MRPSHSWPYPQGNLGPPSPRKRASPRGKRSNAAKEAASSGDAPSTGDTTDFRALLEEACKQAKIFRRQMRSGAGKTSEDVRWGGEGRAGGRKGCGDCVCCVSSFRAACAISLIPTPRLSPQDPHKLIDIFLELHKRLKTALDSLPVALRPITAMVLDESDDDDTSSVRGKARRRALRRCLRGRAAAHACVISLPLGKQGRGGLRRGHEAALVSDGQH